MSTGVKMGFAFLTLVLAHVPTFADESSESPPTPPVYYSSCCPIEIDLSLALDDFRSLPEGSFEGNLGALSAINLKAPLPQAFSVQLAGSYGLYDWYGRSSAPVNSGSVQQQGFITFAASRQTEKSYGFNGGLAYDCMLNKNFGLFAVNPFFYQIRGQMGYLIEGGNELGVWASYGINTANKEAGQVPLQFRAINQVNLFWCHYYKNNGYTMIWAGSPYRRGLMYKSGRPGAFTLGAQFSIPMTSYFSIQGTAAYMGARNVTGIRSSSNYAADVSIGITYSFGKRRIIQGPYMTPANNSNFMADTNQNF
jgi:hypothetical protein